jgi:hypothetical protein
MKTYGGMEVYSSAILNLGTRPKWSASRPCRFIPGETVPGTHCTGGPKVGLDLMEKTDTLPPNGPLCRPARSLVTVSAEVSRLPKTLYILRSAC